MASSLTLFIQHTFTKSVRELALISSLIGSVGKVTLEM